MASSIASSSALLEESCLLRVEESLCSLMSSSVSLAISICCWMMSSSACLSLSARNYTSIFCSFDFYSSLLPFEWSLSSFCFGSDLSSISLSLRLFYSPWICFWLCDSSSCRLANCASNVLLAMLSFLTSSCRSSFLSLSACCSAWACCFNRSCSDWRLESLLESVIRELSFYSERTLR